MTGAPEVIGAWYRVVHQQVWVRGGPSISFKVTGLKVEGETVAVSAVRDGWVKLADGRGWMLIDGSGFGLGPLLERLPQEATTSCIAASDSKPAESTKVAPASAAPRRRRGFTERLSDFRCSEVPQELPPTPVSATPTADVPTPQRSMFAPPTRKPPGRQAPGHASARARSEVVRKRCPRVQDAPVKILTIIVASSIEGQDGVEELKRCVKSVAAQRALPRTLWVSWHAQARSDALHLERELEELAVLCLRRGITLSQVQYQEFVSPWQHVRGVLEKRRLMGGDICNLWVLIGYPTAVWRPESFELLSAAAIQAPPSAQAVWLSSLANGDGAEVPTDPATLEAALVRMPALAEFIAGLPAAVLQHIHCDLAYGSFLRHLGTGWPVTVDSVLNCAMDDNLALDDSCLLQHLEFQLDEVRQAPWAHALPEAQLDHLAGACLRGATALVLSSLFQELSSEASELKMLSELAADLAVAFQLGHGGLNWTESFCSALVDEVWKRLGRDRKSVV